MNDKIILISNANKLICEKLKSLGYKLIYTESVDGFISYEQKHADMQCIEINGTVFVLKNCAELKNKLLKHTPNVITTEKTATGKYPNNILLNAKIIGKNLVGKIESLDSKLVDFCVKSGYKLINVKQGYSGCSILKVADNAVITSDESIYQALSDTEIDVLKISQNGISLFGSTKSEQGFIGGASIKLENSVMFFGDITKHEDYRRIKEFCCAKNIAVQYIKEIELTDIGSGILLNISQ